MERWSIDGTYIHSIGQITTSFVVCTLLLKRGTVSVWHLKTKKRGLLTKGVKNEVYTWADGVAPDVVFHIVSCNALCESNYSCLGSTIGTAKLRPLDAGCC